MALTEAIALGHDCGHGPGGHVSEDALGIFLPDGFDHAVWGADVSLADLNLCEETLDGIRNHSWSRPAPGTPEGEVVSWADRIAYVCHDWEDAVSAGIVTPALLPDRRAGALRRDAARASSRTFIEALVAPRSVDRHGGHGRRPGRGPRRLPAVQLRARLPAPRLGGPGRRRWWRCCGPWWSTSPTSPTASPTCAAAEGWPAGATAAVFEAVRLRGGDDRPLRHGHGRLATSAGTATACPGAMRRRLSGR